MVYQPNKAIHPGLTVQRTLDSLGMTQKKLSERTGLSEKHISQIINGEASITAETALLFENALSGSSSFWLNLDSNFKSTKARLEQIERATKEIEIARKFPYRDLVLVGEVADTLNWVDRVISLWKFFGVNSLQSVKLTQSVAYRRKDGSENEQQALAAWLRYGEIKSSKIELCDYNESRLKALFPKIRQTSITLHEGFFEELQQLFAGAGVGLVAVNNFKGTQASGASRWIGNNPLIQLSARGRNADGIWFTLFHEIGHILLHGKKQEFVEFSSNVQTNEEQEADIFARRSLMNDDDYNTFLMDGDYSESTILKFAEKIKIDPGIVVGRLQIERIIPYTKMQHLHKKLKVTE